MRYRLRTLLIVLALGPQVQWAAWALGRIVVAVPIDDETRNPSYPDTDGNY
jgi:hypothetical protein